MFIGYLFSFVILQKRTTQFLNGDVFSLIYKSSRCIIHKRPLSYIYVEDIFYLCFVLSISNSTFDKC